MTTLEASGPAIEVRSNNRSNLFDFNFGHEK